MKRLFGPQSREFNCYRCCMLHIVLAQRSCTPSRGPALSVAGHASIKTRLAQIQPISAVFILVC